MPSAASRVVQGGCMASRGGRPWSRCLAPRSPPIRMSPKACAATWPPATAWSRSCLVLCWS
eukprot:13303200-Alexandrium_andersonii.AAC.1